MLSKKNRHFTVLGNNRARAITVPLLALPKKFLGTLLDLFIRDDPRLVVLFGVCIVARGARYGVGSPGSLQRAVLLGVGQSRGRIVAGRPGDVVEETRRLLHPVDAQQTQREAQGDADNHRADGPQQRDQR